MDYRQETHLCLTGGISASGLQDWCWHELCGYRGHLDAPMFTPTGSSIKYVNKDNGTIRAMGMLTYIRGRL